MKTSKEYTAKNFMGYGDITVPAGTKVTHKTALGDDPNYHFVDEYIHKGSKGTFAKHSNLDNKP